MSQLGRSEKTLVLMVSNGVVYVIAMLIPLCLVRFLSKLDYGTYSQTYMIGGIFYTVFQLGVVPSIYHFLPLLQGERRRAFLNQSVIMLILQGLVAAICLMAASDQIGKVFHNPALSGMLRIYSLYLFLITASDYYRPLLIARGKYRLSLIMMILENGIKLLFLMAPLFYGFGIKVLMVSAVIFALVRFTVYSLLSYVGHVKSLALKEWSPTLLKDQIHFSLPLGLMSIAGIVGEHLDKVIVSSFLKPEDYAIYAIGAIEIPLASILQSSVMTVLRTELPKLVTESRWREIKEIWRESVRKQSLIVLPIFIFLLINAEAVIVLLFTESYRQSVSVFSIYLFLLPLQIANFSVVPIVFKKTGFVFILALIALSINCVLGVMLIPLLGYNGPVLSRVLVLFLSNIIYVTYSARLVQTSFFSLFPWKVVGKITAAALFSGIVSHYAFDYWINRGLFFLTSSGLLFTGLYFYLVYKLRLLSQWDKDLIAKVTASVFRVIRLPAVSRTRE